VEGIIAVSMFAFHFQVPDHIHEQGRRREERGGGSESWIKEQKRAVGL